MLRQQVYKVSAAEYTQQAEAGKVGLSLLCLGLGDGPFHELGRLAAAMPMLFNAFDFHELLQSAKFPDRRLALEAFRVTPEQAERALEERRACSGGTREGVWGGCGRGSSRRGVGGWGGWGWQRAVA